MLKEVEAGRFREDLYYRLNVVDLAIPPLRERRDDIPLLVEHFLARFQTSHGVRKAISPEVLHALMEYAWPGNVRELANIVERMVILTPGEVIGIEQLPLTIRAPHPAAPVAASGPVSLAEVERLHIASVLRQTGGKKMQTARLLGIDIKTLNKKIKDYGIPPLPGA